MENMNIVYPLEICQRALESSGVKTVIHQKGNRLSLSPIGISPSRTVAADIESYRNDDRSQTFVMESASACYAGIDKKVLPGIIRSVNGRLPEDIKVEFDDKEGCSVYSYSFTIDDESHISEAAIRDKIGLFIQIIAVCEDNILTLSQIMDKAA